LPLDQSEPMPPRPKRRLTASDPAPANS
jgi:hypothetical protein